MIIEKMISGGFGLGRKDGKIYLIRGAYQGEDVDVEIEKQSKDVVFCKVKSVNAPSPKRQIPVCEHFGSCGGCDWMDLEYETQLEYKRDIFVDQMKHIANVEILPPKIVPTSPYSYRNKVEFVIKDGKIGYFGKNSHNFVEINECHIISNALNDIKNEAKKYDLRYFDHLILRESNDKKMAVFVSSTAQKIPKIADETVSLVNNSHVVMAGHQKIITGKGYLEIKVDEITYRIPPKSFFQINYEGAEILSSKVKEYAQTGKNLLDLYCGVGFFTLQVAKNFEHLTGIESSPSSIIEARENAKLNGISNVKFTLSKTSKFNFSNYDVIIADPPRSGIDKETMNAILEIKPERFVYVSCDVATFARDSYKLIQKRYKIKDVMLVDLFPQTHHFEIVSLFERKEVG
jgi:23S rRNA (uracil1939-C5)-methyltransferase